MREESIRLATRGSSLALRQAGEIEAALEERRHEVDLVEVETEGDRVTDERIADLGRTGAFVRALDERVLDGDVDAAVHSMKDVPTEMPDDLVVAAVPRRASAGDALVTPDGTAFDDLPEGAVVGTSSMRRGAQIRAHRPDLEVAGLRGNVDTRVEKLLASHLQAEHEARQEAEEAYQEERERAEKAADDPDEVEREYDETVESWFESLSELEKQALGREVDTAYDAIVLARAGLERSGLAHGVNLVDLPTGEFVPAPGQGALAVTAREGTDVAETIQSALDHPRSRVETTVERVVLEELGGGCIAPIGVHAFLRGEVVRTDVQVYSADGTDAVTETRELDLDDYAREARELADDLADAGGAALIAEATEE
ncbi:hydroxymethylbilane synthase [Halarchaeum rubridurum]|uniref:Hydroxymethylbilane synthase n=1 Tax=Halarchaeum rubridurum TaxID=489911 RepID=A0A830G4M5_9EURY|nr:hydroxymethylbilane synthase [Halarchaeum rubridurum]MBP1955805.1 hydroxymethylbilane synthase [Halarchaeum rubridurum]GGM74338.1 porphobilinogen deaminase [Halarchaeum rubridurum]